MIGIILQTPNFLKYDLLRRICPFIYSLYICCIPDTVDMKYTRKTNSVFMRFLVKRGSTNKSVNKVGRKKLDILEKQPVILEETCTKLCRDLDFFSQL